MKLDAVTAFSLACTGTDGLDFVGEANYQVGHNTGVQEPKETESSTDPALNRPAQGEGLNNAYEATGIEQPTPVSVECRDLTVEVQAKGQAPLRCLYSGVGHLGGLVRSDHQLPGEAFIPLLMAVHQ